MIDDGVDTCDRCDSENDTTGPINIFYNRQNIFDNRQYVQLVADLQD